MNKEIRSFADEVRMVDGPDGKPMIRGYAAKFGVRSQVLRGPKGQEFVEIIKPGAFARSIGESDIRGLFNHDPNFLLGRRSAGTLKLIEDEIGLRYEIDPPDTSAGRDVAESLRRGDLSGSSFSFATVEDSWSKDADGMNVRELRSAHVFDVGPVTFPAYLDATAAYRSFDESRAAPDPEPVAVVVYPTPAQVLTLQRLRLAVLS